MSELFSDIASNNTDYIKAMQGASSGVKDDPSKKLGQADFLRLLTTQLQNQDPSKPMDPTNFVTDLTQMSQLDATTEMNTSIAAMANSFQSLQTMQAASLIGKNVQAVGEDFSHTAGSDSQFVLRTDQPLTDVKVLVTGENGIIKEMEYSSLGLEDKMVSWDGLNDVGVAQDSGVYSLTAYGTDPEGELVAIETVVGTRVNAVGVESDGKMTITLATGERVSMDAVREISG